tara:strand:- start:311 stop:2476 length:2166 start_codon:yes stop_codon:yes gene_type:complete
MAVKHEIKSQLAKLLATEDLIVEHKVVETAVFNVHTRVLTLPQWDRASNNVYDALVAHEVGHALYTPDREWYKEIQIPPSFVNIVEDVRIEKLMKRRYAGLAKCFYNGYNELNDQDFFSIDGKDLTDFNIADRVNLYFKVGAWNDISFSDVETQIVRLIGNAETFDETLSAAQELYNLCKEELKNKEEEEINTYSGMDIEGGGNIPNDIGEEESEEESEEGEVDYQTKSQDMEGGEGQFEPQPQSQGGFQNEPQVETADALEDAIKDLTNIHSDRENVYFELPKLNLKKVVIDNEFIHNNLNLSWVDQQQDWNKMMKERKLPYSSNLYEEVDSKFVEFKRNAQKEVNYLVKEFECKKAASSYARATTARTGVLDCSKLHTYKYNEDLFKKVTTLPEGKNHGLVFVLDWSGSMSDVLLDTVKQLYNLLWFCKKINIPFEVYAFTNEHPPVGDTFHRLAYEKKEGLALVPELFSMMNLFTSKTKNKELEVQMKNIFRLATAFSRSIYTQYHIPIGMNLSGTPLNEAIISLHQILPQFKNNNNVEKVQCVILTDGEASPMMYSKEFQRHPEEKPWMGSNYVSDGCILRNRKTGYTYSCEGLGRWADVTNLLLKDLRQTFSDTNLIGIRVIANRDAGQFVRQYAGYEGDTYDKMMKRWRRERSFTIKNSGYNSYFGLSSNALANEDEFEVKEDATKAQIKRAFVKSLKTKKMNKKILGEFIELVV